MTSMLRTMKPLLIVTLVICCQSAKSNGNTERDNVTILLTELRITENNLKLGWKIKNDTNHNVWICDNINPECPSFYEYYLDIDNITLVLRRKFNWPIHKSVLVKYPLLTGRYTCLHPGQEKDDSVLLVLPVLPYRISIGESGCAELAKQIALEVGFFNEDLPELILHVVDIAEKLKCDCSIIVSDPNDMEIAHRFFGGWAITKAFNGLLGFKDNITSGKESILIPYLGTALNGEQVLRLTIDDISIPYGNAN